MNGEPHDGLFGLLFEGLTPRERLCFYCPLPDCDEQAALCLYRQALGLRRRVRWDWLRIYLERCLDGQHTEHVFILPTHKHARRAQVRALQLARGKITTSVRHLSQDRNRPSCCALSIRVKGD